jgi:ABC-type uncharacterized transport system auxiliary subunit
MWLAACGGAVPETRYYQFATPTTPIAPGASGAVVAVEPLVVGPPYDDARIIYRLDPYRLDYYNYDRWSASPGALVATYLSEAFAHSGRFHAVVRSSELNASLIIGGRVVALEEIDRAGQRSLGRVAVELEARAAGSTQLLWRARYDELEPMTARDPEAFMRAATEAMRRVAGKATQAVAALPSGEPAG